MPPGYDVELERRRDPVMHGKLKFERRMRNRMGVFIAYEWVEVTSFERVTLHTRYPDLPTWLDQYEVPAYFIAELPPCLVYYGLCMMEDPCMNEMEGISNCGDLKRRPNCETKQVRCIHKWL